MDRLQRLFQPRSIAVVGGGAWCAQVILQCQKMGFAGAMYAVHPSRDDIAGITPLRDVAELPQPPDAVFIGVNRHATIEVVSQLARMGAGGAVCFASGFREAAHEMADGDDLQTALLAAAGDMPVLGPNCYGFLNYLDGVALWPDQHGGERVESGVALVMQSSNVAINMTMQMRGLPVAFVATVGNQAQTGLSEIGQALLANPKVTALGLYVEGIDDLAAFVDLAKVAQTMGKPIVALKVGRSEQAQQAAISHTASIAGSDAGADALLARLGIGRATSLSALLETLKLLHVVGPLASAQIASLSCSGGEASLMADTAIGTAVSFPPLQPAQRDVLRAVLGPLVALSNPLDYHTFIWGDVEAMTATYAAMMTDEIALGVVVLDFPRPDKCTSPDWDLVLEAVGRAQVQSGRPIAVLSSVVETMPEAVAQGLVAKGVLPMCGMPEALEAINVAATVGVRSAAAPAVFVPPDVVAGDVLNEAESKAALAAHGVVVPLSRRVAMKDLAKVARDLSYPLVLKGEGIAHKTEAGAVAVGLQDEAALLDAARSMPTEAFLVEEMIADTVAELLIGVVRDPAHGYVLTVAAGGVLTELLADSVNMTVPVERQETRATLTRLRIGRVLQGYRGGPAAHIEAIIDAVMAVQSYVLAETPFEVEINPLLCGPTQAIAVDALITTGDPT
ncbi:acetate--CoA ligase family protein [Loktanella sp. Alg231-35]|uniref:acetate--CoA ligase family protein n=1 Tax=Loktanella sp. Alg231-35 TaxID=1922220 RepID=UPI000D54EC42|nr:acetate--CoA ligase family protein [Loktanella sp. Alg231-35]